MASKGSSSPRTPLQIALDRGSQPGADLAKELRRLDQYKIKSQADAEAICSLLARIADANPEVGDNSAFHSLVGLFQQVDGRESPAFEVMVDNGIGLLVKIVDADLQSPSKRKPDDVLFALKVLAMYGTVEGTDIILRAARQNFQPDAFMWSVILRAYDTEHPQSKRFFEGFSDPLPTDFLAVSLLDCANAAQRDGADWRHPFDSKAGTKQLERWLTDSDEEHFSYAVSAAAALPFTSHPDALLALAFDHLSTEVQLEGAWAAAKLGRETGIKWLARSCLDVNLSERAKHYLSELDRSDAIPHEASDPSFAVKAEFAQWLAHPNELGRAPDELEIIDYRELKWPPDFEPKGLCLIKFRAKDSTGLDDDDVGVGMVGSVTFCLSGYKLEQRPPDDCYALHCYWEMNCEGLIAEMEVKDNSTEYDQMLLQCNIDGLNDVRILFVMELSEQLNYPQKLVAGCEATHQSQPGWVVLDGPRSRWYPANEMPSDVSDKTVAMIHIGRVLLGFKEEPDRRSFLQPAQAPRTPSQIVAAYENLLETARTDPRQAKKLLAGYGSVLGSAFTDYVGALSAVRSQPLDACTCAAYESLLAVAERSSSAEVFESHSPLGEHFDGYVDALIALARQKDIPALVEKFRPHFDHNLGYSRLGTAAFKSGHDQIAETFILKLRQSTKHWRRNETICFLAEIWCKQGRSEEAYDLLIDALKGLQDESRTAEGSDRKLFEDWFQTRRATYLKLFPKRENELGRHGIASSTLTDSAGGSL